MQGEHAVPTLDAAGLVAAIPELARFRDLQAENVLGLPGPQISLEQGLEDTVAWLRDVRAPR